jgi:hypothetical protein
MTILLGFANLLALASALPQASNGVSSFQPLPSDLTNPVNQSFVYSDENQKPIPLVAALCKPECKAAFTMIHVTSSAQPYIDNKWGWTADHSLDGGPNQNIATGRRVLIKSTKGAWLVGTASEYNTLYQYNLNKAQNVYIGMQQTETACWQGYGTPEQAPKPWSSISSIGDPDVSSLTTSNSHAIGTDNPSFLVEQLPK